MHGCLGKQAKNKLFLLFFYFFTSKNTSNNVLGDQKDKAFSAETFVFQEK